MIRAFDSLHSAHSSTPFVNQTRCMTFEPGTHLTCSFRHRYNWHPRMSSVCQVIDIGDRGHEMASPWQLLFSYLVTEHLVIDDWCLLKLIVCLFRTLYVSPICGLRDRYCDDVILLMIFGAVISLMLPGRRLLSSDASSDSWSSFIINSVSSTEQITSLSPGTGENR